MCFANAVLQMLVHSPPFWNLFRELGDLKRQQRGAVGPESDGDAIPLVDATVRLFEEFTFKEKKSHPIQVTQPSLQQAAGREPMEDEGENEEQKVADTFEPTYMYDAIKEKRQLKNLIVRSRNQDAPFYYWLVLACCIKDDKNEGAKEFLSLYLDALDEELIDLHTYISTHKPASVPNPEELEEEAQSPKGLTEVRKRDHMVC
jgi:Ubiquitin carboxyl-terminal hydrolase